jgi:hypothetical protein
MSDLEYLLKKNPNAYVSEVTDEVLEVVQSLQSQLALAREVIENAKAMMKVLPACSVGYDDGCPWCGMNKALAKLAETMK